MSSLSDELLHECQGLLYRKWAEAFDALKKVKEAKNDGTPDWAQFQIGRLANAKTEEARLKRLLEELNKVAPLTRRKG